MKNTRDSYFGGKAGAGVVQTLVNHVPPHDVLLIPFAGHCALSRRIRPCRKLLLLDLDPKVGEWWSSGRLPEHADFRKADGLQLLESIEWSSSVAGTRDGVLAKPDRVCIYCDPPYRLETRTSDSRYRFDWDDSHHARLLEVATRLSATGYRILISHYPNQMYDHALRFWNRTDFTGQTRGGPRIERLYFNFEITDLHDFRFYCGTSSTQTSPRRQREVMKRREQSALRKIRSMAPLERKRFLRRLAAEFSDAGSLQDQTPVPATVDRPKRKAGRRIDRPSYR
jgi:DNA adenine methylase